MLERKDCPQKSVIFRVTRNNPYQSFSICLPICLSVNLSFCPSSASSAPEADLLAKEQSKNKLLSLCLENGRRLGFNAPVSSQNDVYKMYNKIQKLAEPDQLSIMRREIKFKKLLFSELPANYPLFKQYNITAKPMFQNLLALHAVDESNQESVSVEDIYDITESLTLPVKKQTKKSASIQEPTVADLEWPPQEEEFVITLDEDEWNLGSVQAYLQESDEVQVQLLTTMRTRAKDDCGKIYWMYSEDNIDCYKKTFLTCAPLCHWLRISKGKSRCFHY